MARRRSRLALRTGERALAWAETVDGRQVAGTRDALYVESSPSDLPSSVDLPWSVEPVETRIPWEDIHAADWDPDTGSLRVSEVGRWGEPRPEHAWVLEDPRRLLQLVRERVSASVVLQRRVTVRGKLALMVIARRAPRGDRPIAWQLEYDEGLDPDDPEVRRTAQAALASARQDVGDL